MKYIKIENRGSSTIVTINARLNAVGASQPSRTIENLDFPLLPKGDRIEVRTIEQEDSGYVLITQKTAIDLIYFWGTSEQFRRELPDILEHCTKYLEMHDQLAEDIDLTLAEYTMGRL